MRLSGPRLTVVLVVGLVVVALVGGTAAIWISRHVSPGTASLSPVAAPAPTGAMRSPIGGSTSVESGSATAAAPSSGSTGSTNSAGTSAGATVAPIGPTAGASTNLTVQMTTAAQSKDQSGVVQNALQRYFDAINQHDYQAWSESVATTLSTDQSEREWTTAYSSTTDSTIWVDTISGSPVQAAVRFTSQQELSLAPQDLQAACIMWRVTYLVVPDDGRLVIGATVPGSVTKSACQ